MKQDNKEEERCNKPDSINLEPVTSPENNSQGADQHREEQGQQATTQSVSKFLGD